MPTVIIIYILVSAQHRLTGKGGYNSLRLSRDPRLKKGVGHVMAATVCVQVAQASITVRDVDGATTAREIIERLKSSCNRKGPQVSESNAFGTAPCYGMYKRF